MPADMLANLCGFGLESQHLFLEKLKREGVGICL